MKTLVDRALVYGRMIKFSHSVFALPFALASAAVAAEGRVPWRELPWIVLAMIGARSAAMGFNRLADQAIDARNPRTAGRELPRGLLSRREVWLFVGLSALALVGAAAMLNPLCLLLSPVALLVVLGYSYTKRFTSLSHLVLGLALFWLAPAAAAAAYGAARRQTGLAIACGLGLFLGLPLAAVAAALTLVGIPLGLLVLLALLPLYALGYVTAAYVLG